MAARSLRERLAQFDGSSSAELARTTRPTEPDLSTLLARGARRVGEAPHGYLRLEELLEAPAWPGPPREVVPSRAWRLLTTAPAPDGSAWAVLDTETTGLESGVGTLVFLVAILHWDARGARLVQLFLPEPAGEPAFLAALLEELEDVGALVSYNGRCFDLPRLISRLRLCRLDESRLEAPHLDLLHPCRRLARNWLTDSRLSSVERGLLGLRRSHDLPGSEVPAMYRRWLSEGRDVGLGRVLEHNRQDVLSLLALSQRLAAAFLGRPDALPTEAQLGLGHALLARSSPEMAAAAFGRALGSADDRIRRRARWALALLHRRRGEVGQALRQLEALVDECPGWIAPRVELAKIHEHRRRDLDAAAVVVEDALAVLQRRELLEPGAVERGVEDELLHRLGRLRRRRARKIAQAGRPRGFLGRPTGGG